MYLSALSSLPLIAREFCLGIIQQKAQLHQNGRRNGKNYGIELKELLTKVVKWSATSFNVEFRSPNQVISNIPEFCKAKKPFALAMDYGFDLRN